MNFALFSKKFRRNARKSISQYKEETLLKQGREQIQELVKKGLGIPVALL